MNSGRVNVICMKWGTKYGPEYVNRLYSMVRRHMSRSFRFVCLTDDHAGLDSTIERKAIPQIGIDDFDQRADWCMKHGWLKVATFASPLHDLSGPTLFLDLDLVIVDQLDCFFEIDGEFRVIDEWDKRDETGNTSVYRFEAGAHPDLICDLKKNVASIVKWARNDQEFVSRFMHQQNRLRYWPEGWCVSFKRHCVPRGVRCVYQAAQIPHGAKIVVFHGKPNPPDAIAGRSGRWYRRVRPVPWVAEHWC